MTIANSLLNLFVTPAYADTAGQAPGSNLPFLVMIGVFMLFMYFSMIRPQQKRAKEQQSLMTSLTVGDEVLTIGGVVGKIAKMTETYVTLCIAENVNMTILKSSISNALPKGTLKSI